MQIQLSRHLPKVGAIGEVSGGSYLLSREGNPVLGRLGDKHAEEGCWHRWGLVMSAFISVSLFQLHCLLEGLSVAQKVRCVLPIVVEFSIFSVFFGCWKNAFWCTFVCQELPFYSSVDNAHYPCTGLDYLLPQSLQLVTCIFCFPSFIHGTRYPFRVSFLSFQYLFSVLIVVVANVWWCLWNVLRFFLVHWFLTEIQLLRSMPTYLHVWFVCLTTYT